MVYGFVSPNQVHILRPALIREFSKSNGQVSTLAEWSPTIKVSWVRPICTDSLSSCSKTANSIMMLLLGSWEGRLSRAVSFQLTLNPFTAELQMQFVGNVTFCYFKVFPFPTIFPSESSLHLK